MSIQLLEQAIRNQKAAIWAVANRESELGKDALLTAMMNDLARLFGEMEAATKKEILIHDRM